MRTAIKLVSLIIVLVAVPSTAAAQSHGYAFFGPGGVTSYGHTSGAMYTGVGGEGVFGPGIGAGAEIGYTAPWRYFSDGLGIASVNGSFHFHRRARVVPFVTAGYSLFFRSGHENGMNFGGGVNWWFVRKLGLKLELRDHVGFGGRNDVHFWAIRAGITFR